MDPFFLPKALIAWTGFWFRFWSKHLGKRVVLAGLGISTFLTIILIIWDSA